MGGRGLRGERSRWFTGWAVSLIMCAACSSQLTSVAPESPSAPPTATASPTPAIRGCVPECSTTFHDPGSVGPGEYRTLGFLDAQLKVTYPSAWVSHEDQGVEFSSAPKGSWNVHRVLFWDDILPWVATYDDPYGHGVDGVANTTAGWLEWLGSNPAFKLSKPREASIGQMRLPATYVDIAIAPDAPN
jgi:hypothetical protein